MKVLRDLAVAGLLAGSIGVGHAAGPDMLEVAVVPPAQSGVEGSSFYALHLPNGSGLGGDGDSAWSNAPPRTLAQRIRAASTPYGTELRFESLGQESTDPYTVFLFIDDSSGGSVTLSSNRLTFNFILNDRSRTYAAEVILAGRYTPFNQDFYAFTNVFDVLRAGGSMNLPGIVNARQGDEIGRIILYPRPIEPPRIESFQITNGLSVINARVSPGTSTLPIGYSELGGTTIGSALNQYTIRRPLTIDTFGQLPLVRFEIPLPAGGNFYRLKSELE